MRVKLEIFEQTWKFMNCSIYSAEFIIPVPITIVLALRTRYLDFNNYKSIQDAQA